MFSTTMGTKSLNEEHIAMLVRIGREIEFFKKVEAPEGNHALKKEYYTSDEKGIVKFYYTNGDLKVVYSSKNIPEMLGYTHEDFVGMRLSEIIGEHPKVVSGLAERVKEVGEIEKEQKIIKPDGAILTLKGYIVYEGNNVYTEYLERCQTGE